MGAMMLTIGGIGMQVVNPNLAAGDNFIIAGPLNLDKRMMRADTVMGERLQLNPPQFRTLLMLVSNEGSQVSFEDLHMFMTMPNEDRISIQAARDVISTLVNIVNISGRGFAKIDVLPGDEYVFATKWGMDWSRACEALPAETKKKHEASPFFKSERLSKIVLSVAMAASLLVFIGSYLAYQAYDDGLVYIPMMQIPLANMPGSGETVTFPSIRGDVFYVGADGSIFVETYNVFDENHVFVMCLRLAFEFSPLAVCVLVPRGEAATEVRLFEPIESGKHKAEFAIRVFCQAYLTEVKGLSKQVFIYLISP